MRIFSRRSPSRATRGGFRTASSDSPRKPGARTEVQLSEQHGVRTLHLGSSMIQSAMRLSAPDELEVVYVQCMMGFTLFHPQPETLLMIGLGGGSLAKFVHQRLPSVRTTAIEINPQVVTAARAHFFLPQDDDRLQVLIADGGEYVAGNPASTDILMVDGFEDGRHVPSLTSQAFYDRARAALNRHGVLVVNLLSRDKGLHDHLARIETSFNGRIATLMAEPHGNLIVFAFKHASAKKMWEGLPERASQREEELGLPFTEFIRRLNRHKEK